MQLIRKRTLMILSGCFGLSGQRLWFLRRQVGCPAPRRRFLRSLRPAWRRHVTFSFQLCCLCRLFILWLRRWWFLRHNHLSQASLRRVWLFYRLLPRHRRGRLFNFIALFSLSLPLLRSQLRLFLCCCFLIFNLFFLIEIFSLFIFLYFFHFLNWTHDPCIENVKSLGRSLVSISC